MTNNETELKITVHSYGLSLADTGTGTQERHTEVEMKRPVLTATLRNLAAGEGFLKSIMMDILPDVKYSNKWLCQFCRE